MTPSMKASEMLRPFKLHEINPEIFHGLSDVLTAAYGEIERRA